MVADRSRHLPPAVLHLDHLALVLAAGEEARLERECLWWPPVLESP